MELIQVGKRDTLVKTLGGGGLRSFPSSSTKQSEWLNPVEIIPQRTSTHAWATPMFEDGSINGPQYAQTAPDPESPTEN